jgi:hypothetical protein
MNPIGSYALHQSLFLFKKFLFAGSFASVLYHLSAPCPLSGTHWQESFRRVLHDPVLETCTPPFTLL